MYLGERGAVHCDCHRTEKKRVLMRRAKFPEKHIGCTVSGYTPKTQNERVAKTAVMAWVKGYKPGCSGLYLFGDAGGGKTHLLVAVGKALIEHFDAEVLYVSTAEMVARTKAQFNRNDNDFEPYDTPFDEAAEAEVLLLDDIGSEKPSEWLLEQMYRLINTRYNAMRTTLITSNLNLQTFESNFDARIADRIHEMCQVLHCDGPSRRREKEAVKA